MHFLCEILFAKTADKDIQVSVTASVFFDLFDVFCNKKPDGKLQSGFVRNEAYSNFPVFSKNPLLNLWLQS